MGEWGTGTFRIGGKTDRLHGPPLECEATVAGLYDGQFEEPQPRHGGFTQDRSGPDRGHPHRRRPDDHAHQPPDAAVQPAAAHDAAAWNPRSSTCWSPRASTPRSRPTRKSASTSSASTRPAAPPPTWSSSPTTTAASRCFRLSGNSAGSQVSQARCPYIAIQNLESTIQSRPRSNPCASSATPTLNGINQIRQPAADGSALEIDGDIFGKFTVSSRKANVTKLLAPIEPTAILCIGLNYRKHAEEGKNRRFRSGRCCS